jgi:quercetin dioxygenase-like cupin family protein
MAQEIKGIPFDIAEAVAYVPGSVVSKTVFENGTGSITIFSFDKGEGLSEHTSPFDAVVHIVDGAAEITVGGAVHAVSAGQMIIMPSNIPHALKAASAFKMLLIMIRA